MKVFDTHSHLQFPQYDADREQVIASMQESGLATITVGTDFETSRRGSLLAGGHDCLFATIGVHPTDSEELFDPAAFAGLLTPKVVAVGECGLDYYRSPRDDVRPRQLENFERQIAFAREHDLALMLHVRPSKGTSDAHEDALELLEREQKSEAGLRGTSHFFTSTLDVAKRYWALGFAVSIPGVVTFSSDCDQVIREAPEGLILAETDAPYAAPAPYRGKRNEPAYVHEVIRRIAALRGALEGEMSDILTRNACRVFRISEDSCA